jgi:hypothetical protein
MQHNPLDLLGPILLIFGGVLAAASLIVAKQPEAAKYIAKIQPYQAFIGFALLVIGVWSLVRSLPSMPHLISANPAYGAAVLTTSIGSILLGIMFGMPVLSGFSPQGAAKGRELAQRLAPFQVLIGLVGIVAGVISILLWAGLSLSNLD